MAHVSSSSYEQLGVSFMLCEPAKIGCYSREGGERIGNMWRRLVNLGSGHELQQTTTVRVDRFLGIGLSGLHFLLWQN